MEKSDEVSFETRRDGKKLTLFSLASGVSKGIETLKTRQLHTMAETELFADDDYKSIQRILSFFTTSLVLVSTVVNFYFTWSAYQTAIANENQINFLFDNWQANYITDIITLKDKFEWPDGYEPMVGREWPGTVAGWDCTNANVTAQELFIGECDKASIKNEWKDVGAIDKMPLAQFHGRIICVQRQPKNFLQLERPDINGRWYNTEYKRCGGEEAASSRITCVKFKNHCPINDIMIVDSDQISKYPAYRNAQLDDNLSLLFTTQGKSLPVVQFKLTEGVPWIAANEYDFTDNRLIYKLTKEAYYKGCITYLDNDVVYDERYRYVGTDDEYSLYEDNNVLEVLK
jgi:hypothetical protein